MNKQPEPLAPTSTDNRLSSSALLGSVLAEDVRLRVNALNDFHRRAVTRVAKARKQAALRSALDACAAHAKFVNSALPNDKIRDAG